MNERIIADLLKTKQDAARVAEFLADPIIAGFLDRLEAQFLETAINGESHQREEARVAIVAFRTLRKNMKLALQSGEVAKTELAKTKDKR